MLRRILSVPIGLGSLLLVGSGCLHLPPEPLDLTSALFAMESRSPDIPEVGEYALRLSALRNEQVVFDSSDGLTLPEAEAVALWFNAEARGARQQADWARRLADASGRLDDPTLTAELGEKRVEQDAPTGLLRGARASTETTWIQAGGLSITIPFSGRLRAEREAMRAEYRTAELAALETEWRVLMQLNAAWLEWSAQFEHLRLLEEHLEVLGRFADVSARLNEAGEIDVSTAQLFAVDLGRKQAQRDRAALEEGAARVAVLHTMGLLPDAPVTLTPTLQMRATTLAEAPLAGQLAAASPTLARLRAAYETAEAHLRLELRRQYPDLTLSPVYADEQDETSLTLGLGLPIPVFNANRPAILQAAAERDNARAEVFAAYEQLLADAAIVEARLTGAAAQVTQLRERVAPQVDEQLLRAKALLAMGEIDVVLVYESLAQAIDVKEELLEATLAQALAQAHWNALAGSTLAETEEEQ